MHEGITDPRELHRLGLEAELREEESDYREAHELFGRALELAPRNTESLDTTLLRGDIMRDDAFTYTREATAVPSYVLALGNLALAQEGLDHAQNDVARHLIWKTRQLQPEDRAKLHANLGATYSLLGRTAVVAKEISLRANLPQDGRANRQIRETFSEAHKFLRQGDNGYYLTSNALAAARFEMAFGSIIRAVGWQVRSIRALRWTKTHDPQNYAAAIHTFQTRGEHLQSRDIAEASILVKP